MISAQEARNRFTDIQPLLDELDGMIKSAADKGEHKVAFYSTKHSGLWSARPLGTAPPEPTGLQNRLIEKLLEYGYKTSLEPNGQPYIPVGLRKDESDLPTHVNFVLVVKWR